MAQLYAIYMYKETHFQYNNKGRMKIRNHRDKRTNQERTGKEAMGGDKVNSQ